MNDHLPENGYLQKSVDSKSVSIDDAASFSLDDASRDEVYKSRQCTWLEILTPQVPTSFYTLVPEIFAKPYNSCINVAEMSVSMQFLIKMLNVSSADSVDSQLRAYD